MYRLHRMEFDNCTTCMLSRRLPIKNGHHKVGHIPWMTSQPFSVSPADWPINSPIPDCSRQSTSAIWSASPGSPLRIGWRRRGWTTTMNRDLEPPQAVSLWRSLFQLSGYKKPNVETLHMWVMYDSYKFTSIFSVTKWFLFGGDGCVPMGISSKVSFCLFR